MIDIRHCPFCGHIYTKANPSTIDHLNPIALGGTNAKWNLMDCCFNCNRKKGCMLLSEWLQKLPGSIQNNLKGFMCLPLQFEQELSKHGFKRSLPRKLGSSGNAGYKTRPPYTGRYWKSQD